MILIIEILSLIILIKLLILMSYLLNLDFINFFFKLF